MSEEALAAARMAFEGSGPWRTPQCPHCRELVASALAEIDVKAGIAAEMPVTYLAAISTGGRAKERARSE